MVGDREEPCCPKAARGETEANNYKGKTEAKMGKTRVREEWNVNYNTTESSDPASRVQEDPEFSNELELLLNRPSSQTRVCGSLAPE